MKKTLRFFMLLVMAVVFHVAYADEVTFDFATAEGIEALGFTAPAAGAETSVGTTPIVSGDVTITATDGTTSTRFWQSSGNSLGQYDFRIYTNGTLTFSVPSGKVMTSIAFTKGSAWNQDPEVDNGSFADYTWTGSASNVVFSFAKQDRISKIVVTYNSGTPDPVASSVTISGETEFTTSTTVTISSTGDVEQVFYTLDGTEPSQANGTLYINPFTLTETATVKAIGLDADDEPVTDVVEKTFTKSEVSYVEAATIAEFNALAANTDNVKLILKDAVVLGIGNNNIVVNDGTGGTDIYRLTVTAKQGDKLNGYVVGKRVDYQGITELSNITENEVTVTESTITAVASTVAELAAAENFGGFYKLSAVTTVASGSRFNAVDGEATIQLYDNFRLGITLAAGTYDIEGIVGQYGTTKQFWVTKVSPVGEVKDITNTVDDPYTVAEAIELIEAGESLDQKVYVKGIISSISEISTQYGNATYNISDDGTETADQLTIYRGKYLNGEAFTAEDQIKVGDEVIVYGNLMDFNGVKEMASGTYLVSVPTAIAAVEKKAELTDAPLYNIAGQRVNRDYKGVVIQNGKKFILK